MTYMPSINLEMTGRNIMELRCKAGISVKDLQMFFGFSTPQAIYKWQKGSSLPTVDNLIVLAKIFHTSIEDILILNEGQDVVFYGILYIYNFFCYNYDN